MLLYLLPADPVRQIAGRSATPQTVENIRHQLGLDQPFAVQYWRYLGELAQRRPRPLLHPATEVAELIVSRLPATLLLMVGAIVCELADRPHHGPDRRRSGAARAIDQALMVASFVGVSAPQFVVGLLLLYVFAVSARLVSDQRLRQPAAIWCCRR